MVSPLIRFPDEKDHSVFEFKGKLYHLDISTTAKALTDQQITALTQKFVNLLNTAPEIQNLDGLADAKIDQKGFEFHKDEVCEFTAEQKETFQKIAHVGKRVHEQAQEVEQPSKPLSGRVQKMDIPAESNLARLLEGLKHIFLGLGETLLNTFWRSLPSHNHQNIPPVLSTEHIGIDGEKVGQETVTRFDSVQDLIKSKEAQLDDVLSRKPLDGGLKKTLQAEIERYKKYHGDHHWVTSHQLRDDMRKYHKNRAGSLIVSPHPDDSYIPAIINSRMHVIEAGDKSISVHRSGAMAYLPDGSKSYAELKNEFIDKWATDEVEDKEAFIKNPYKYIGGNGEAEKEYAQLRKHERALVDQMVQYVSNQVGAHAADFADPASRKAPALTRTLQLTQVSLVNPNAKAKTSGLKNCEATQMKDMAYIFEKFNGKKIVFVEGINAPFYSEKEDLIKLPKAKLKEIAHANAGEMKLSCTFFDINVHGNKINADQMRINKAGLENLRKNIMQLIQSPPPGVKIFRLKHKYGEIKKRLDKGENSYDLAKEIILLQHDMQGGVGVNCFSGKDRTGYLLATLADDQLSKAVDRREDLLPEDRETVKKQLRRDLIHTEKGIASTINWENTSFRFLKITEFRVLGLNKGEGFIGHIRRLGYGLKALSAPI